ncbi:MAG: hypothetical protein Q4P05_00375 [Actinomycetaceae bacterium]|nr:hypothetical protein [Actinomycetaceae bacterium]
MLFSSHSSLPAPFSTVVTAKPFQRQDRKRPALKLSDGNWLLLASLGPYVISETDAQFVGHWHEIQRAKWDGETQTLSIHWVDPARQAAVFEAEAEDPQSLMMSFEEYVEYAVVTTGQRQTHSGTIITASIRRRPDGELFSALVVDGSLDEEGEQLAHDLESKLRESVGLDY